MQLILTTLHDLEYPMSSESWKTRGFCNRPQAALLRQGSQEKDPLCDRAPRQTPNFMGSNSLLSIIFCFLMTPDACDKETGGAFQRIIWIVLAIITSPWVEVSIPASIFNPSNLRVQRTIIDNILWGSVCQKSPCRFWGVYDIHFRT